MPGKQRRQPSRACKAVPPLTTFHLFSKLPAEIRAAIWEMSVESREVMIAHVCKCKGSAVEEGETDPAIGRPCDLDWEFTTSPPRVLNTCPDSRFALLPKYEKVTSTDGNSVTEVLVNFSSDTFHYCTPIFEEFSYTDWIRRIQRLNLIILEFDHPPMFGAQSPYHVEWSISGLSLALMTLAKSEKNRMQHITIYHGSRHSRETQQTAHHGHAGYDAINDWRQDWFNCFHWLYDRCSASKMDLVIRHPVAGELTRDNFRLTGHIMARYIVQNPLQHLLDASGYEEDDSYKWSHDSDECSTRCGTTGIELRSYEPQPGDHNTILYPRCLLLLNENMAGNAENATNDRDAEKAYNEMIDRRGSHYTRYVADTLAAHRAGFRRLVSKLPAAVPGW